MHFQDSLLCKWKQGEKRNCPYHGTCDNQRNYRTVQLQAERYQAIWDAKGNRAIAHRIKTAGIKRKITNDQVRVIRTMLSGTHEDMMNIAAMGSLMIGATTAMLKP